MVNVKTWSAAIVSGGSCVSASDTPTSSTVTVHASPSEKSASGPSVYVVGPPESVNECVPLAAQEIANVSTATETGSLKVTTTSEPVETSAAPFAGVVTLAVAEGDQVKAGATVATIEAMKMEASITAAKDGTVSRLAVGRIQQVEGGDLLVEIS